MELAQTIKTSYETYAEKCRALVEPHIPLPHDLAHLVLAYVVIDAKTFFGEIMYKSMRLSTKMVEPRCRITFKSNHEMLSITCGYHTFTYSHLISDAVAWTEADWYEVIFTTAWTAHLTDSRAEAVANEMVPRMAFEYGIRANEKIDQLGQL